MILMLSIYVGKGGHIRLVPAYAESCTFRLDKSEAGQNFPSKHTKQQDVCRHRCDYGGYALMSISVTTHSRVRVVRRSSRNFN